MKKFFIMFGILLGSLLLILLVFHLRYPFVTPMVGNWSVGYQQTQKIFPEIDISNGRIITYKYINKLLPENINYIADPFFIVENGIYYLFVEQKGNDNADIALLTSPDGKNFKYEGVVLNENFHLSYPQVFKYNNDFYMLPETAGAKNVLLYKALQFPHKWEIIDTLIKGKKLKDPTILLSADLNLIVAVDDNLKQYMFVAETLFGRWKESDDYIQRWGDETRPGGRFFNIEGEWFLPLQNMSKSYGTGISLYQLKNHQGPLKLEPSLKLYLKPQPKVQWFNRGMHHLDVQPVNGSFYIVYDGDRNLEGKKEYQYKRTIKLNLIDLYNYFFD